MEDFNAGSSVGDFCQLCNLKHLIKVSTCHKNPDNPSTIDLTLTNAHRSFYNSCAIEAVLFDFHKMEATVLKTYFENRASKLSTVRTINFSPIKTTDTLF